MPTAHGAYRSLSTEPQRSKPMHGRPLVGWDVPFPSSFDEAQPPQHNTSRAAGHGPGKGRGGGKPAASRDEIREMLRLHEMIQALRMCHDR